MANRTKAGPSNHTPETSPADLFDQAAAQAQALPPPPPPPAAATTAAPDPFDPDRLRLNQDFAGLVAVKRKVVEVSVRKPSAEWWNRTSPNPAHWIKLTILELKEDAQRGLYLLTPELVENALADQRIAPCVSPRWMIPTMNRAGKLFLWPVREPDQDGRPNPWLLSALNGALAAKDQWVQIAANMALGAYTVNVSDKITGDPEWPEISLRDMLQIAFGKTLIESWDHPILQQLRGEV